MSAEGALPPRGPTGAFQTQDGNPTWVDLAVDEAVRRYHADGKGYGSLLTKDWLCSVLGIINPDAANSVEDFKKAQFAWMAAFGALEKRLLTKHDIALANVRGEGYRVVTPQEQAKWAATEGLDEVTKALSKMSARINHTNLAALDHSQRIEHNKVQDHATMVKRWVASQAAKPVRQWKF